MQGSDHLITVAMIFAMACVFAVALTSEGAFEDTTYTIAYVLNGGVNDPDNPAECTKENQPEILPATREGMVFYGWFTDSSFSKAFTGVIHEDTTLYALWQQDLTGKVVSLSVSGYSESGTVTTRYSGTVDVTYLAYDPYDLQYITSQKYSYTNTEYEFNHVKNTWTSEGTVSDISEVGNYRFIRTETISTALGEKLCNVASYDEDGATVICWEGADDAVLYKQTYEASYGYCEHTIKAIGEAEVPSSVNVELIGGYGMKVSYEGDPIPGHRIKVIADPSAGFSKWCDADLNVVSDKATFYYVVGVEDIVLEASNGDDWNLEVQAGQTCDVSVGVPITQASMTIEYVSGAEDYSVTGAEFTFDRAGEYSIRVIGIDDDGNSGKWSISVKATGTIYKTHTWTYDETSYTVDYEINYQSYLDAAASKTYDGRKHTTSEKDAEFVVVGSTVRNLSAKLSRLSSDLNVEVQGVDLSEISLALSFVQSIGSTGGGLWSLPIETLYHGFGDTADKAILFSALMSASGYRTVLLIYSDHMAVGVAADASGSYYSYNGTKYYYCEVSSTGYAIGEKPDDVGNVVAAYVEIAPVLRY